MTNLVARIRNMVEGNPWHGKDGKFSNPKDINKQGKGSYSGERKYSVGSSGGKPTIRRADDRSGRDARPTPARRTKDGRIPKWARDRYSDNTLRK